MSYEYMTGLGALGTAGSSSSPEALAETLRSRIRDLHSATNEGDFNSRRARLHESINQAYGLLAPSHPNTAPWWALEGAVTDAVQEGQRTWADWLAWQGADPSIAHVAAEVPAPIDKELPPTPGGATPPAGQQQQEVEEREAATGMPWWGWGLVAAGSVGVVAVAWYFLAEKDGKKERIDQLRRRRMV